MGTNTPKGNDAAITTQPEALGFLGSLAKKIGDLGSAISSKISGIFNKKTAFNALAAASLAVGSAGALANDNTVDPENGTQSITAPTGGKNTVSSEALDKLRVNNLPDTGKDGKAFDGRASAYGEVGTNTSTVGFTGGAVYDSGKNVIVGGGIEGHKSSSKDGDSSTFGRASAGVTLGYNNLNFNLTGHAAVGTKEGETPFEGNRFKTGAKIKVGGLSAQVTGRVSDATLVALGIQGGKGSVSQIGETRLEGTQILGNQRDTIFNNVHANLNGGEVKTYGLNLSGANLTTKATIYARVNNLRSSLGATSEVTTFGANGSYLIQQGLMVDGDINTSKTDISGSSRRNTGYNLGARFSPADFPNVGFYIKGGKNSLGANVAAGVQITFGGKDISRIPQSSSINPTNPNYYDNSGVQTSQFRENVQSVDTRVLQGQTQVDEHIATISNEFFVVEYEKQGRYKIPTATTKVSLIPQELVAGAITNNPNVIVNPNGTITFKKFTQENYKVGNIYISGGADQAGNSTLVKINVTQGSVNIVNSPDTRTLPKELADQIVKGEISSNFANAIVFNQNISKENLDKFVWFLKISGGYKVFDTISSENLPSVYNAVVSGKYDTAIINGVISGKMPVGLLNVDLSKETQDLIKNGYKFTAKGSDFVTTLTNEQLLLISKDGNLSADNIIKSIKASVIDANKAKIVDIEGYGLTDIVPTIGGFNGQISGDLTKILPNSKVYIVLGGYNIPISISPNGSFTISGLPEGVKYSQVGLYIVMPDSKYPVLVNGQSFTVTGDLAYLQNKINLGSDIITLTTPPPPPPSVDPGTGGSGSGGSGSGGSGVDTGTSTPAPSYTGSGTTGWPTSPTGSISGTVVSTQATPGTVIAVFTTPTGTIPGISINVDSNGGFSVTPPVGATSVSFKDSSGNLITGVNAPPVAPPSSDEE